MKERHPHWRGMTRMTWDGIRALDYLASLDAVDASRLGVIGHSLGAKEVLYVAAFDPRVKAAVFSEGGIGRSMSNWDAVWYLGEKPDASPREHHELLALVAPRAFLLLAGAGKDGADNETSARYLDAVRPLFPAHDSLGWLLHGAGHAYPPEARRAAESFLVENLQTPKLKGSGDSAHVDGIRENPWPQLVIELEPGLEAVGSRFLHGKVEINARCPTSPPPHHGAAAGVEPPLGSFAVSFSPPPALLHRPSWRAACHPQPAPKAKAARIAHPVMRHKRMDRP
jgi:hypothetical protein